MDNTTYEKYGIILREMQIRTTKKYNFTLIRMATILKERKRTSFDKDLEKLEW